MHPIVAKLYESTVHTKARASNFKFSHLCTLRPHIHSNVIFKATKQKQEGTNGSKGESGSFKNQSANFKSTLLVIKH